ncbi:MAG: hypothetical protein J6P94_05325, partial [Oscillospiraceae bacterium]|nr:hypothetical protein [Oscillospiraceae bacterium]
MKINLIWEHNGDSSILYAENFPGAFTRGKNLQAALEKMPGELRSYAHWSGDVTPENFELYIVQDLSCELNIADADSDCIFDSERQDLTPEEYLHLKELCLRSARDFQRLYDSVPDKNRSVLPFRSSFYGAVPRTAREMYEHTKSVTSYYFAEIGVDADNEGDILSCREKAFAKLESTTDFLSRDPEEGSYGEIWS